MVVALLLNTMDAMGQVSVTKSGTSVMPVDYPRATPHRWQKSGTSLPDPTAGTYLVVTRGDLLMALEPFLEWKRQQGYRVEVLVMTTRESDSIKAALQARYDGATALRPAQKYVLLVGDVGRLKSCQGRYTPTGLDNSVTDLYYGEYTGDYIPEALVGRLSVSDSAELSTVVCKTVDYEQGRWASATQMLLTAGEESRANAATTTNGQVHYLSELVAEYRPGLDTVCFYNPASGNQLEPVVRALDTANALINYTAHCTREGWSSPAVDPTTVDTLNRAVPTVWVNNCCLSNAFNTTCFGERLLRSAEGGAVVAIGATNETLWNEDYYWAVGAKCPPTEDPPYDSSLPGAFDRILLGEDAMKIVVSEVGEMDGGSPKLEISGRYDADAVSVGALNYAGCSAVTWAGSPYDAYYWETYCLLGDPSLSLMLGATDTLMLDVALGEGGSLTEGLTGVAVRGSPWSRVSATQKGALLGTVLTDGEGYGFVSFCQGLTGDSLTLTATRPESIFRQVTLPLSAQLHGRLAVTRVGVDSSGTTLELNLRNVGQETVRAHCLALAQGEADKALGAELLSDSLVATIDSLACGAELLLRWPIGEYTIGSLPLLLGHVTLSDGTQSYATLNLAIDMEDLRPQLSTWLLSDEAGNVPKQIVPGDSYAVGAVLTCEADSAQLWVNGNSVATSTECNRLVGTFDVPRETERLQVELQVSKDRWVGRYGGWLLAYNNMEDFESGDWNNCPWQIKNLYPWRIDSTAVHNGLFCARSASVGDNQRSTMALEVETLVDDSVVFYYNVSSEGSDWLYFFVDGRRRGYWSGNSGWQRYARLLPAGKHTLQWIYQKDASRSEREDRARIDDIRLPLVLWSAPYGHGVRDSVGVGFDKAVDGDGNFNSWPNPAVERVTFLHGSRPYGRVLEVYDVYGRMVDRIKIADNSTATQYSTRHLRFGTYLLVLRDKDGILVRKLIVTK